MAFTIFSLVLLAVLLVKDHAKDKGAHTRAKVFHALALAYVVLTCAGSFKAVFSQVRHFPGFRAYYSVPIGLIPAQVNFISALGASVLDVALFLAAFAVAQRNPTAVVLFRIVLLASIPTGVISFYRGFLGSTTDLPAQVVLLIAAIVVVSVKVGLFLLYGSRAMKAFLTHTP